jgi:hypothetical protein
LFVTRFGKGVLWGWGEWRFSGGPAHAGWARVTTSVLYNIKLLILMYTTYQITIATPWLFARFVVSFLSMFSTLSQVYSLCTGLDIQSTKVIMQLIKLRKLWLINTMHQTFKCLIIVKSRHTNITFDINGVLLG